MPARSPGLSSTGPLVSLNPTPNSLAIILLRVVLPNPGGPCSKVWSRGSPLYLAASTKTCRFSTTFCCPQKSQNCNGRKAFSNSFSFSRPSSLMSNSPFTLIHYMLYDMYYIYIHSVCTTTSPQASEPCLRQATSACAARESCRPFRTGEARRAPRLCAVPLCMCRLPARRWRQQSPLR